jgi:plastocyanin
VFNVRALISAYGNNGFQEPNANIREDYDPRTDVKYYCTPLPCEPHIANVPPVADAGISQSSEIGMKVILDGSKSSDSDGSINSFSWAQTEGPKVKLYNSETSKAYFFLPTDLTTSTKLVFELTVVDDKGLKAVDSVDVKAIITSNSEQVEKTISQNIAQADIFKVLVRLNNINPNLGYENSAIILKGDLFQKQQLAYQQTNNTGTAETTFVFPSTLIGTGETFVVCVEQSSRTGEEGVGCKIGNNSPSTATEVIEFMLPQSGKLASEVTSFSAKPNGTMIIKIVKDASDPNNAIHLVPFFIKISEGDSVIWKNEDTAIHTITSGTPEGENSGSLFDSSYIAAGKSFKHTFSKSGEYDYYCTLHPFMTGQIVVS